MWLGVPVSGSALPRARRRPGGSESRTRTTAHRRRSRCGTGPPRRPATAGVPGGGAIVVLPGAPSQICGDARAQRAVNAPHKAHEPGTGGRSCHVGRLLQSPAPESTVRSTARQYSIQRPSPRRANSSAAQSTLAVQSRSSAGGTKADVVLAERPLGSRREYRQGRMKSAWHPHPPTADSTGNLNVGHGPGKALAVSTRGWIPGGNSGGQDC